MDEMCSMGDLRDHVATLKEFLKTETVCGRRVAGCELTHVVPRAKQLEFTIHFEETPVTLGRHIELLLDNLASSVVGLLCLLPRRNFFSRWSNC